MRKRLQDFASDPVYNMKAVEQQTGIAAPTLRAWERRYQLIEPQRTPGRYRLYSERDVALLRWVRDRMNEGLTISRAAAMLDGLQHSAEPIWIDDSPTPPAPAEGPSPLPHLAQLLFDALVALDEDRADQIMEQAFALYTMPTIYVEVITPTLVELGEAWHRGEIFITSEHFASAYLRTRLLRLLKSYPTRADKPAIFVGCAQNEQHEIGILIFALMLRQEGFNIVYLGPNLPIDDLILSAIQERPAIVCLSAGSDTTALTLQTVQARLNEAPPPAPMFAYGGRAFDLDPTLCDKVPGHYLGADPRQSIHLIAELMRNFPLPG